MANAKVNIAVQDRSVIIPALAGITVGTVVASDWGPIVPRLVASPSQLETVYAEPNNAKGASWHGANLLLAQSNSVYINRVIHDDARYSAALVRFKVDPVDFNSFPAPQAMPDRVVSPLDEGLGLDDFESYAFPEYATDREYDDTDIKVSTAGVGITSVIATGITDTNGRSLESGDIISFGDNPDNDSNIFEVESAETLQISYDRVTVATALSGNVGDEVFYDVSGTATSYDPVVTLRQAASSSTNLLVSDSDQIVNGQLLSVGSVATTGEATNKDITTLPQPTIVLTSPATVTAGSTIQRLTQDELEYRDAFLVSAVYPGARGDRIKVGIRPSTIYPDTVFLLDVYFDGVMVESFDVSRVQFTDELNNQLFLETRINGVSEYIRVKENVMEETKALPIETDNGIWRQNPVDIFNDTSTTLVEDVVEGDTIISIADTGAVGIAPGNRIKIGSATDAEEYKILTVDGVNNLFTIDRRIVSGASYEVGDSIFWFNPDLEAPLTGVFSGVQYFRYLSVAPQNNIAIGGQLTISGNQGTVVDAGWNNVNDGYDGDTVTVSDVINAFQAMSNKNKYPIACWCENSFASNETVIALDNITKRNNTQHVFASVPFAEEIKSDSVGAAVAYRNSTNLNSSDSSLFAGWIRVTDTFNQTQVWVPPSVFALNAQSFVTRDFQIFTPAAGWTRGVLNGLAITQEWEDGERDRLITAQVNPIRFREGRGFAIWGNETLYTRPSPLQLRSVNMLLLALKTGLEDSLEFQLFELNDPTTYGVIEAAVSTYIRDTFLNTGGVTEFQVEVASVTSNTDRDNRRVNLFIGLKPTTDIQLLNATVAVFNQSVTITT